MYVQAFPELTRKAQISTGSAHYGPVELEAQGLT